MKRIVLIGTARHWIDAPFTDPDCEIWGTGTTALEIWQKPIPGTDIVPRWDVWFDIHCAGEMAANAIDNPHYAKFLSADHGDKPILTDNLGPDAGIPNGVPYPREEMFDEFGEQFFRSSFDYMAANAIKAASLRKQKVVDVYGFDMAHEGEYADQRPSAQHFMWIAEKVYGVTFNPCADSKLMNHPQPYGTEPGPMQKDIHARVSILSERLREKRALHARTTQEINYLEGSIYSLSELCIANYGVKPKQ